MKKKNLLIKWIFITFLLGLLAQCLVISLTQTMCVDEFLTLISISDPSLKHSIKGISYGINGTPPLYFIITWAFYKIGIHSVIFFKLFSWLGFIGSLVLQLKYYSKRYNYWNVAVILIFLFGTSKLVYFHNAELRYYSFFFFFVTLSIISSFLLVENPRSVKHSLLFGSAILACCFTHIYGTIYSIAILISFLIYFFIIKKIYWTFIWLTLIGPVTFFIFWGKQLVLQSEIGVPHSPFPVPGIFHLTRAFFDFFPFGTYAFNYLPQLLSYVIIFSVCAILLVLSSNYLFKIKKKKESGSFQEAYKIILGINLFFIPVCVSFFISHFTVSIFEARYFLPSLLSTVLLSIVLLNKINIPGRQIFIKAVLLLSFMKLAQSFISFNTGKKMLMMFEQISKTDSDGIIFEYVEGFLAMNYYVKNGKAIYPMDWRIAVDTSNGLHPVSAYKIMLRLKELYGTEGILSSTQIFQPNSIYYVIDDPAHNWYETYLAQGAFSLMQTFTAPDGSIIRKIKVN